MATLAALKPYIDLGMTAQIIRPSLLADGDLEQATLYIYKMPIPEDKKGFTGFYYHDYYDPVLCQRSHGYNGSWRSLKRYIEEFVFIELKNSSAWTLDPGKQWK